MTEWILCATGALALGFLADLLVGDPHGWPHLIRGFGFLIAALERALYPMKNKRAGGTLLVVVVLLLSAGLPALLLFFAWRVSPWLYVVLETVFCWQILATKSLRDESRAVYAKLASGDLPGARKAVSMIVGRDTDALDVAGVTRAAVETVAENASDGVAAPLFYTLLGGAALGCLYKAANTMDSMVGYKNERYLDFGRAAARLDDAPLRVGHDFRCMALRDGCQKRFAHLPARQTQSCKPKFGAYGGCNGRCAPRAPCRGCILLWEALQKTVYRGCAARHRGGGYPARA